MFNVVRYISRAIKTSVTARDVSVQWRIMHVARSVGLQLWCLWSLSSWRSCTVTAWDYSILLPDFKSVLCQAVLHSAWNVHERIPAVPDGWPYPDRPSTTWLTAQSLTCNFPHIAQTDLPGDNAVPPRLRANDALYVGIECAIWQFALCAVSYFPSYFILLQNEKVPRLRARTFPYIRRNFEQFCPAAISDVTRSFW